MSLLVKAKGITKLSEIQIDADKDWGGKGITYLRQIAAGMDKGHIVQHNGLVLETLPPGPVNYVLTSAGPGKKVVWAPGGTYLHRYFPVTLDLGHSLEVPLTPTWNQENPVLQLQAPCGVEDHLYPGWVKRLEPELEVSLTSGLLLPDEVQSKVSTIEDAIQVEVPAGGGLSADGGILYDYTSETKSGLTKDQSYDTGDDGDRSLTSPTTWEAQTFTTGLNQWVRGVKLKLHKSSIDDIPGMVTVSIRNTDAFGHPTGADLCQGTFDGNALRYLSPGDWLWIPFTTGALLVGSTRYAIVVRIGGTRPLYWRCDASSPTYEGGCREYSTNAGSSWTTDTTRDFMFQVFYTLNDMPLLPDSLEIDDGWYWGYEKPFDRIYQDIGVAGGGSYQLTFEYSRGSGFWAPCVDLEDGTNAFHNLWLCTISHSRQADWESEILMGKNLYWIRARVTDLGSDYSPPRGTFARVGLDF